MNLCAHKYARFHFNIKCVSVGGGFTLVVINHSITHLSEFRQVGEREGPWGKKVRGKKKREVGERRNAAVKGRGAERN